MYIHKEYMYEFDTHLYMIDIHMHVQCNLSYSPKIVIYLKKGVVIKINQLVGVAIQDN